MGTTTKILRWGLGVGKGEITWQWTSIPSTGEHKYSCHFMLLQPGNVSASCTAWPDAVLTLTGDTEAPAGSSQSLVSGPSPSPYPQLKMEPFFLCLFSDIRSIQGCEKRALLTGQWILLTWSSWSVPHIKYIGPCIASCNSGERKRSPQLWKQNLSHQLPIFLHFLALCPF